MSTALQRESAMVNDLQGVRAFCIGVLSKIMSAGSIEVARVLAECALADLAEHQADPGRRLEDPADWNVR